MPRPKNVEAEFVPDSFQPLTGVLDNRSTPDMMPPQSFRRRQNWWVPDQNKLCRSAGWTKAFPEIGHNADLHDQLLALQAYFDNFDPEIEVPSGITTYPNAGCNGLVKTRTTGRQPLTLLFNATSTFGVKRFIAASESRIYVLDAPSGDYKIIGDGFGAGVSNGTCPKRRFYASQNQDAVFFTNDFDDPVYWLIDQQTFGCDMQAVSTIAELMLIGVRKAAVTWTFRRSTFFANCEVDGVRRANRLYWSDDGNPFGFDPADPESVTGFKDLGDGEVILGAAEVSGYMLIFTDQSIWQMTVVGGSNPYVFNRRYTPKKAKEACLYYRNTLVCTGDTVYYLGSDGFYKYNLFVSAPERAEWSHRATGTMFSEINATCCDNHVAEYSPGAEAVFISYASKGSLTCCPDKTLVLFTGFEVAATMDFGTTAFCNVQIDMGESIRDWIIRNCVCTAAEMDAMGYGFVKQGLPLSEAAPVCDPPITSIYTNQVLHIEDLDIDVEDYTKAEPDADSLCARLGDTFFEDECNECELPAVFIFASSEDWCLKQFGGVYYRERCSNPTAVGSINNEATSWQTYTSATATYVQDGYDSYLTSGPQGMGYPNLTKQVNGVHTEFVSEFQTVPNLLYCRYGQSSQVVDPLDETNCALQWFDTDPIKLACQSVSAETHATDGTRPDEIAGFAVWNEGNYLYFELSILGTGGAACFSRVTQYYKVLPETDNYR